MVAYKIFRLDKQGKLHPLFINKKSVIPMNVWLKAECIPTKGFAVRQGWHCTLKQHAPHLKLDLASGEHRVWCKVEVQEIEFYNRPESQGGMWCLAQQMRILEVVNK